MNFQDMISKMTPQMLAQGLKQLSGTLTPEQLKQAEAAIKSMGKDSLTQQMGSMNPQQLMQELQRNPALLKQLSQNPQLMQTLSSITKNK